MNMYTRSELETLRRRIDEDPAALAASPDELRRLLDQAEYALECAALLDEAVHFPAEPYSEAEVLVARLTDGVNGIWNRHRYRSGGGDDGSPAAR